MDDEYVILSIFLIVIGTAGIVLFNGPKTPAGDSCVCIIPSPESGAMQGTSGVLLIFGVMFIPIGLLKGGPPSFRRGPPPVSRPPIGRVFTPVPFTSPRLYGLGALLLFIGLDILLIPAILVTVSIPLVIGGAVIAGVGGYMIYQGTKMKSKT